MSSIYVCFFAVSLWVTLLYFGSLPCVGLVSEFVSLVFEFSYPLSDTGMILSLRMRIG